MREQTFGIPIRLCREADCRVPVAEGTTVSFISPAHNCQDQASNPATLSQGASGHLPVGTGGALSQALVDALLSGGMLGLERRQVCLKPKGESGFITTGLSFSVQVRSPLSTTSPQLSTCNLHLAQLDLKGSKAS